MIVFNYHAGHFHKSHHNSKDGDSEAQQDAFLVLAAKIRKMHAKFPQYGLDTQIAR